MGSNFADDVEPERLIPCRGFTHDFTSETSPINSRVALLEIAAILTPGIWVTLV